VRKGARRRRTARMAANRKSDIKRVQTAALDFKNLKTQPRVKLASTKRKAMTWAEIQALQAELKAKAAKQAAQLGANRGRRRYRKASTSPKLTKLILERRERLRQRAAAKKAGSGNAVSTKNKLVVNV